MEQEEKSENFIATEITEEQRELIEDYKKRGKLHPDWIDIPTYDLVQLGYPRANHGGMVARAFGGTDSEDNLLPGNGMWCKKTDVDNYIDKLLGDLQNDLDILDKDFWAPGPKD